MTTHNLTIFSYETIRKLTSPDGVFRWRLNGKENKAFVVSFGKKLQRVQWEIMLSDQWVPCLTITTWPELVRYFTVNKIHKIEFEKK